jgi:type VI secretion system protein ImpC
MPGRLEFEFPMTKEQSSPRYRAEEPRPMRIAFLGDFSGRAGRPGDPAEVPLSERRPLHVDVDGFEAVLRRLQPRLRLERLGAAGPSVDLEFLEMDDFHPDRLYDRLELFRELRRLRKRLEDPATFAQAAAELRADTAGTMSGEGDGSEAPAEANDATLERLLGRGKHEESRTGAAGAPGIEALIRAVVAPHIVPAPDPRQAALIESVDRAVSDEMRRVLHHPSFQGLESSWRWIHRLATELECGEDLRLFLIDATFEELGEDFDAAGGSPNASALHRVLSEFGARQPEERPWSLLVGDYTFGPSMEDATLLGALGAVASSAGAPFLAAADPEIVGCSAAPDLSEPGKWSSPVEAADGGWTALRGSPSARWLGLALPRILMRAPYGGRGESIERFEFDELPSTGEHEAHLWGNPAFACAELLARSFLDEGWSFSPGDLLDLEDLPLCVRKEDGESRLLPCAEVYMGERAAGALLDLGLMPFLSRADRNAARLLRFQSLASPPAALAGPWG